MSRISAIVPTFNRREYLLEALESLRCQTRPVDEIIVWDDGSTDGTHEAIAGLQFPNLHYRRAENAGKAAALNQALKLATGDYIWICDDDDLLVPEAAERLSRILDTVPEVGISGGCYNRFADTPTGREVSGPGYWPDLGSGSPLRHLLEDIFLFQNASLVRRICYDRVGPFREDLARSIDYDMIVRLATRYPVEIIDDVVFLQRKHDGDRGPAHFRHAASSVDSVWAAQDKVVFEGLKRHMPLGLLKSMYQGNDTDVARAAHLQRAGIFTRHGHWEYALDDLEGASKIGKATPLGAVENGICRRAVSGKHGVQPTSDDLRRIARLKSGSAIGRQIAHGLGRGLLWSLRRAMADRDRAEIVRLSRILATTGVPLRKLSNPSSVSENLSIPIEAYSW